jgi:GT2 family glycosyltransferase
MTGTAAEAAADSARLAIAVLIPTFNRCPVLERCLAALAAQTGVAPSAFEIVVVDDGSTDGTAAMLTRLGAMLAAKGGPALRHCSQPNAGANAARNRAMAMTAAPLLLFINDDTIALPGMVAEHLRQHALHPAEAEAVLGALGLSKTPPPGLFERLHHDTRLDQLAEGTDLGWAAFFTFNLSVKAALLRRHGGFEEALRWHEDIELGARLRPEGLRVLFAPAAAGWHLHPMAEGDYLRIADREGAALAAWWTRQPAMREELLRLGLQSRRLGTRAARHVAADLVITAWTEPALLALARRLARFSPAAAAALYRKLFQGRKRRAIDATLPPGPAAPATRSP